jgi:hypothetical protein
LYSSQRHARVSGQHWLRLLQGADEGALLSTHNHLHVLLLILRGHAGQQVILVACWRHTRFLHGSHKCMSIVPGLVLSSSGPAGRNAAGYFTCATECSLHFGELYSEIVKAAGIRRSVACMLQLQQNFFSKSTRFCVSGLRHAKHCSVVDMSAGLEQSYCLLSPR